MTAAEYLINGNTGAISFAPTSVAEEVLQNVRTIITTLKGTVPLDRQFGLSMTFLDAPEQKAMATLRSEIEQAVRKYEPRAVVKRVDFEKSNAVDGELRPVVMITIAS